MKRLGDCLGMAFQIKDDILDYSPSEETGKPLCSDLREGKITLPLLAVLESAGQEEKSAIMRMLERAGSCSSSLEGLSRMVHDRGGLAVAGEVMNEYVEKARALLLGYPASPYRDSLDMLCLYIAQREK
jgi:octaprenyl-diphosphate synthase